ncbi:hypothetical protein EPO05_02105 [Patescibacteria group bacterium]|nr:MAG: hypothetical protein EPO05_02105 [Patescibacteria group bacterium]
MRKNCGKIKTALWLTLQFKADFDRLLNIKNPTADEIAQAEKIKQVIEKRIADFHEQFRRVSPEEAEQIMGREDFLGAQAIQETFGFAPEEILPIPFEKEELERAKELGQFLVLRIDRILDGQPLTMQAMKEMLRGKWGPISVTDGLGHPGWCAEKKFYKEDVPQFSWALVTREPIPNSLQSKRYLEQMDMATRYLKEEIFQNQPMPRRYQAAVQEFESQKKTIRRILRKWGDGWQKGAEMLESSAINKLTRQSPVEALYDFLVYYKHNNTRLLPDSHVWTRCSSDGYMVDMSGLKEDHLFVSAHRLETETYLGNVGTILSRR